MCEAAIAAARELAETNARLPQHTVAFNLARRLRKLSDRDPQQFEVAVRAFCEQAGREDMEELWYAFVGVWDAVKHPEGEGLLDLAAKLAYEQPYPHTQGLPMHRRLAAIAWHLWNLNERQTFYFSPKRTAALLGCSEQTISLIKRLLQKEGTIKMVKDYSHPLKKGNKKKEGDKPEPARCQLFTFTGPPP